MRTSDRVYVETRIVLSGNDSAGRQFVENTQAFVINRRGARIISRQTLAPQQKLKIRCLKTDLEAPVQVAGPIVAAAEGWHFGVAFLDPEVNIWGINFPMLDGTESPAGRVFLACVDCHAQEVVHLDVFELVVFTANECLTRPCLHCNETTLWRPYGRDEERMPFPSSGSRLPTYDSGTKGAAGQPQGQCSPSALPVRRRGRLHGKRLAGRLSLRKPQGLSPGRAH